MSDAAVLGLVEELERILTDPSWVPDPEYLLGWNQRFSEATAHAERGPGWEEIVHRAHALSSRVPPFLDRMAREMEGMRRELIEQQRSQRALRGYSSVTR